MRAPPVLIAASLAAALCGGSLTAAPRPYDLIIEHGTVFDGSGASGKPADVAVLDGRIAAVGRLDGVSATRRIDAAGLYVAPGFINVHDHSEASALPTALNMLTQGETTAILNPDGWGELDLTRQMADLARPGLALNIGAYSGFNAVWEAVVGKADTRPTPAQIETMRGMISRNLEQGAWGVSAGLDYKPAYFARSEEVVAVVSVAGPWRTTFPNHDRITPESGYSSVAGVAETISIASAAGLSPEITHMKAQGRDQGKGPLILDMMRRATAAGHYAPGDVYPYLAGMTALYALTVPGWAQAGGETVMLARFKDRTQRPRIVKAVEEALDARFGGANGVYLPTSQRRLTDVAATMGVSPGEALLRVVESGEVWAILTFGAESDLRAFLREPTVAITCDCGATLETHTHPRAYGTFPRVLGRYVRETGVLTWEEAIRKMTGQPAASLGMVDRGLLAPGMAADIVVFDPKTIIDHATFESPAALSDGVRYVLVNGRIELAGGKLTGEKAGAVLLRADDMPTRPMVAAGRRHLRLEGVAMKTGDGRSAALALDVDQVPGGATTGLVALKDAAGQVLWTADRLGPLQIADHGFSLTGFSETAGAFVLIVDAGNPRRPGVTAWDLRPANGPALTGQTAAGLF